MRKRERKQIEFNCTHGTPQARAAHCAEAQLVLRQDLARLREKAAGLCAEFAATLEAHTSRAVAGVVRPRAIAQDVREARLVKGIAWGLTVIEVTLSFFLAFVFLVNPLFAVLLALAAIFSLKAGLLALWRNDAQPQWTRRQLRRWVIRPSLAVTLLAAAVLFFTRSVMGWLALLLAPFVMAAVCVLSFGMMGLAAGLFALGYLLSWSRHAERRYDALEREAIQTRRTLERVTRIAEELQAMRAGVAPERAGAALDAAAPDTLGESAGLVGPAAQRPSALQRQGAAQPTVTRTVGRSASWLPLLFLLGLALGNGGCSLGGTLKPAAQGSAPVIATPAAPATTPVALGSLAHTPTVDAALPTDAVLLDIWLDWSLSAEATPYREAVQSLVAALPVLTARHRVARITARQFGDRGWSAPELLQLNLPQPTASKPSSEAEVFYRQIGEEHQRQAAARYDTELRAALAAITPARLLPDGAPEPPCTDLQGALARIAADARPHKRLVFLLTDGAESCAHTLRPVAFAEANVALVIVVLPEETTGRAGEHADDSWRQRREQLQTAAPGARIVPYFADLGREATAALTPLQNRER